MDIDIRTLSKSSLVLIAGSGINQFLILLVGLFSAKFLGPEYYGILALASSINVIFVFFIELGFHHYLIRQIARNFTTTSYYYSGVIWVKILLFIPMLLTVYIFMKFNQYSVLIITITLITAGSYVVNSFVYSSYAILQAHSDMKFIAMGYISSGFLTFVTISIAIIEKLTLYYFALIPLVINGIILIYVFILIKIKYSIHIQRIWIINKFIRTHLRQSLPFGITGLFVTFYTWSDSFWLSLFHGEKFVGYFNVSFKIIIGFFIISQGINMTVYPVLSNLYTRNKKATKELFQRQVKIMSLISLILMIVIFFLAHFAINFLLGSQFTPSILVLQLLVFIIPLIYIRSALERLLEATGNQLKVTYSYGIGSLANIFLNVFFIYFYAIVGAAIAMIFTDFIIFCVTLFQVTKIDFTEGIK